ETSLRPVEMRPAGSSDPLAEPGSVGVVLAPDSITFRASQAGSASPYPRLIERHIVEHGVGRWTATVEPLRACVATERAEEARRVARLTVGYGAATPGDGEGAWLIEVRPREAVDEFEVGEPVEVSGEANTQSIVAGRVHSARSSSGELEVQLPIAFRPST